MWALFFEIVLHTGGSQQDIAFLVGSLVLCLWETKMNKGKSFDGMMMNSFCTSV